MALPAVSVTLRTITTADTEDLLAFELENRVYFSRWISDRSDEYYDLGNLKQIVREAADEVRQGARYMHLVRDAAGELVGRVNLFDVTREPTHSAEIGYRLAERHTGKGYATAAVGLAVRLAFEDYGLHRLAAATSPSNLASQLVLLKNGFQFWGRSRSSVRFHGVWEDSLHFEKIEGEGSALLR